MCGITGVVAPGGGEAASPSLLERMRDALAHRGPDDAGSHFGPGVALGHRRLSIVDLAGGHQPMASVNGRYVIVFNGEIFNHPQLKAELEQRGVQYRSRSDTETILHVYEELGTRCVDRFRGMFAFAIWDTERRRLLLARDRFGVKPLYYRVLGDGRLAFASEIKALTLIPGYTPELNLGAVPDFLANHAPTGEETLFRGVKRLPPGHVLEWQDGKLKISRYWDLEYPRTTDGIQRTSDREVVAEYRSKLVEAVRLRLMSDVPLGVFLSGGIDSAAITAVMSELVGGGVRSFSVAFQEREANELHYARLVANRWKTEHHEILLSPMQFFDALPGLVYHEDEPIAHPSSVALYWVSKLAAQHVKVVLTGEGSDELLAGYNRYRVTKMNLAMGRAYERLTPAVARSILARGLSRLPKTLRARQLADRTFLARGADVDAAYFDNFAVFDRAGIEALLTPQIATRIGRNDPYAAYHAAFDRVADRPVLSRLLYADVGTYLQELLMKQDQMSMAASIESRVPFLDHEFAGWVARLPDKYKLRGLTTKWVLREAMRDSLPAEILSRRKMGFPVPVGQWFRGAWRPIVDEFVLGERARARGLFRPEEVRRIAAEHGAGLNHSERLWALVTFEMWCRIFLDAETASDVGRGMHSLAA